MSSYYHRHTDALLSHRRRSGPHTVATAVTKENTARAIWRGARGRAMMYNENVTRLKAVLTQYRIPPYARTCATVKHTVRAREEPTPVALACTSMNTQRVGRTMTLASTPLAATSDTMLPASAHHVRSELESIAASTMQTIDSGYRHVHHPPPQGSPRPSVSPRSQKNYHRPAGWSLGSYHDRARQQPIQPPQPRVDRTHLSSLSQNRTPRPSPSQQSAANHDTALGHSAPRDFGFR